MNRFWRASMSLFLGAATAASTTGAAGAAALALSNGRTAKIDGGIATIYDAEHRVVERRLVKAPYREMDRPPNNKLLLQQLNAPRQTRPYVDGQVLVVLRPGITVTSAVSVTPQQLGNARRAATSALRLAAVPALTSDRAINQTFADMGVSHVDQIGSRLSYATSAARIRLAHGATASLSGFYRAHITASSVYDAVRRLRASSSVAFAEPDWRVTTMNTPPLIASRAMVADENAKSRAMSYSPRRFAATVAQPQLPTNYALTSSAQSLYNAPSTNMAAAYDLIEKNYHQLPGQGVRITNVSLGSIVSGAVGDQSLCGGQGPTAVLVGGQHYLDFPSMPLIPAYSADPSGTISGSDTVCSEDGALEEVGLDFSMMAPLPHAQQPSGSTATGIGDLLDNEPGAQYRLMVPTNGFPATSDLVAAFLAATTQSPRPDVITMSLGFGEDAYGFPSRYFEEDPLVAAAVSYATTQLGEVVCISANDGTRLFSNAAVDAAGGSAATTLGTPDQITDLDSIYQSTSPSVVVDSGAIDAGGSTLDDIFSVEPQDPRNAALHAQHAFPEVRWNGGTDFSSGFGSRVNVSAPSDNVLAYSYAYVFTGNEPDGDPIFTWEPVIGNTGGTSASAPETAAAAAVAIQVARLAGRPFSKPQDVRNFLIANGSSLPNVPQADRTVSVGPQINLDQTVEALMALGGKVVTPAVPRVAVEQRRSAVTQFLADSFDPSYGAEFFSATNPSAIDLTGSAVMSTNDGRNQFAWITIAPDWEGVPQTATYRLALASNPKTVLATTRWSRLLPADILGAAGLPLVSTTSRTVNLVYSATLGKTTISAPVSLTFGPASGTHEGGLAPVVPAVVNGQYAQISYDITSLAPVHSTYENPKKPTLVISEPARMTVSADTFVNLPITLWHPRYSVALTNLKGTINVPVSSLDGAGVYGASVNYGNEDVDLNPAGSDGGGIYYKIALDTNFAFFSVPASRPPIVTAPQFSQNGSAPTEYLELNDGTNFTVSWDVSNVPLATGAILEFSAPGHGAYNLYRLFNNPRGDRTDHNGIDTSSYSTYALPGVKGSVSLSGTKFLSPSTTLTARVIPTIGSTGVAEAGDESSIYMYGVKSNDYSPIIGYAVGRASSDAVFTTETFDEFTAIAGTAQTFDQVALAPTGTIATSSTISYLPAAESIFAGSLVPIAGANISNTPSNKLYETFDSSLAPSTLGPDLSDFNNSATFEAASNVTDDIAFGLAYSNNIATSVRVVNLKTNAELLNDSITDLTHKGSKDIIASTPVYDPTAKIGYFATSVNTDECATEPSPSLTTVNTKTNALVTTTLPVNGVIFDMALDPATHVLAMPTSCGQIVMYNTLSGTSTVVSAPGPSGSPLLAIAVDQLHHLFVGAGDVPADILVDNEPQSAVFVLDESGRVTKTIAQFGFYESDPFAGTPVLNTYFGSASGYRLVVNDATRTGYVPSDGFHEIHQFSY